MSTAGPTSGGRCPCAETLYADHREDTVLCQGKETSGQSDTRGGFTKLVSRQQEGGHCRHSAGAEKLRGQTPRSGQKQTGARRGAVPVINSFQARIKYKLPGPPREKGLLDRNKHICQRKYLGTHARTHACTQRGRKSGKKDRKSLQAARKQFAGAPPSTLEDRGVPLFLFSSFISRGELSFILLPLTLCLSHPPLFFSLLS